MPSHWPTSRLAIVEQLTNEYGKPLVILPWWREAFAALDDPEIRELILWLMRQSGKSQWMAAAAVSELLITPGAYVVFLAAAEHQAAAVYTRKVRRPLEKLVKALGLTGEVKFTQRGVEVPAFNSALEVLAANEATGTARSPTLLLLDEARDVPDGVYTAMVPSTIGAGGKIVIGSTAGSPSGFFYELCQHPTPGAWLYHSNENENPQAHKGVLAFLKKRFSLLAPSAGKRELENEFADDGDSFLPTDLIEAAVDDHLGEVPQSTRRAFGFLDLSRKHDLTSLVVVTCEPPRRPEAADHLVVASIQVWDPKRSPTREVPFAEVRAALLRLPERFPNLMAVLVDEGAEAGSVLPWTREQYRLVSRVRGFIASASSNIDLWSALAARLHGQTISIPRHERLLAELKNLRQESFAFGSKWRVVDATRKLHRDVSLALAGACYAAAEHREAPELRLLNADPIPEPGESSREFQERARREDERRAQESADEVKQAIAERGIYWPGD
jgi:hypothetical protein